MGDNLMCGITNNWQEQKIEAYHTWTFAGDPNYFPYKGQVCDCGLTKYEDPTDKPLTKIGVIW